MQFNFIQPFLQQLEACRESHIHRPIITLSYAQSIDGSIALDASSSLSLSEPLSLTMTHVLRAHHDALLVGINTILVDDPQLNVRLFDGKDPQAIILDCQLRFPKCARILTASSKSPIIITTKAAPAGKKHILEKLGITIYEVEQTVEGRVDLSALLNLLLKLGLKTVMVEGGGEVINEFYSNNLVDYCVITIAPQIIGGLKAVCRPCVSPLTIQNCQYHKLGSDLIVYGAVLKDEI